MPLYPTIGMAYHYITCERCPGRAFIGTVENQYKATAIADAVDTFEQNGWNHIWVSTEDDENLTLGWAGICPACQKKETGANTQDLAAISGS